MQESYPFEEKQGSVIRGLLGALAGALIGAAVWAAVGILTDYVYSFIGFVIGFLTVKGYDLCGGRKGAVRIILVIVLVILAVVLGDAVITSWYIHSYYVEALESLPPLMREGVMTEAEYFMEYLKDSEFVYEVLKEMGTSLFYACIGCLALIPRKKKNAPKTVSFSEAKKAESEIPAAADAASSDMDDRTSVNQ